MKNTVLSHIGMVWIIPSNLNIAIEEFSNKLDRIGVNYSEHTYEKEPMYSISFQKKNTNFTPKFEKKLEQIIIDHVTSFRRIRFVNPK